MNKLKHLNLSFIFAIFVSCGVKHNGVWYNDDEASAKMDSLEVEISANEERISELECRLSNIQDYILDATMSLDNLREFYILNNKMKYELDDIEDALSNIEDECNYE